jgi:hypothetical protein
MAPETTPEARERNGRVYAALVTSFILGLVRITQARGVQLSLEAAILRRGVGAMGPATDSDHGQVLGEPVPVPFREYDSFRYVGAFGHLIYATTLFDTFLTDTTRFMFLMFPGSIGKSQGATISDIVAAKSTTELLCGAVEKSVREVSYKSFLDRIAFLEQQFKMHVDVDAETHERIQYYSGVRNVLIHDQAFFDLSLGPTGEIEPAKRVSGTPLTPVSESDIEAALEAYDTVVRGLAHAVFRDVLKLPTPKFVDIAGENRLFP